MICLSGFMQSPQRRTAWCARCDSPQECDGRGCIACWNLRLKNSEAHARYMRERRAELRAAKLCINGAPHGAPVPGTTKCARCIEVHRASGRSGS